MVKTAAKPKVSTQWKEVIASLDDLKPYERNPRKISREAFDRLKDKIRRFGYHQRLIATRDLRVIGGHQRLKALRDLGMDKIAVLVPQRKLTDQEFRELLITDNLPFGEFDMDMLGEDFAMDELEDFGMPKDWFNSFPKAEKPEADPDFTPAVDPMAEVIDQLPMAGDHWPWEDRAKWLRKLTRAMSQAYKEKTRGKIVVTVTKSSD